MPADALTLSLFFESWPLFREAVLAGTIAGALLGFMGVYVIIGRMVFLSAALSQVAGLGVTLAFYAQLHLGAGLILGSPILVSLAVTLLAAALVARDRSGLGEGRDGRLGTLFLVGAAGSLVVGTRIVEEIQDIQSVLFGSAVAVLPEDLRLTMILAGVLLLIHLWWLRGFLGVAIDPDGSRVRGLPVDALQIALLVSLATAISMTTRVIGALPVFAFSVLPALAAIRLAPNVQRAIFLAGLFGATAGFLGYLLSFLCELPVGASQALVAAAFVLAAEALSASLRRLRIR